MRVSKSLFTSSSLLVLLAFSAGCKIPSFGLEDREIATDWKPSWPFSSEDAPAANGSSEQQQKAGKGALPFAPSQVAKFDFRGAQDLVLPAGTCELDADSDELACGSVKAPLVKATQSDGTEIAVLVVKTLTVPGAATLELAGGHPLAIVAQDRVVVQGSIVPGEHGREAYAGGGATADKKGGGPGGGTAGAGGSFCGKGGLAAAGSSAGRTYGAAALEPLVAGSAGGGNAPGGGGGALQIAAGKRIHVTLTGAIHLDGKDATTVSGMTSGGGSGGALLLEAPEVQVDGAVTANGGAGDGGGAGAAGASGDRIDGKAAGEDRSGGGGGAGRIRIHTRSGKATLGSGAVVSPALTTPCASQGKLAH